MDVESWLGCERDSVWFSTSRIILLLLLTPTNQRYYSVVFSLLRLTPQGPYVLEFNCRFGDPETQVLLPLLETDLYEVMKACCDGKLNEIDVRFKENTSAATVVCAAKGYPQKYPKGMEITGLPEANSLPDVKVYHAGTKIDDGAKTRCSGGRVLAVTGLGDSLKSALKCAYSAVNRIDFVGSESTESLLHRRTDIAKKATEKKLRIGVLGSTRGTALIPVIEACQNGSLHAEIVAVVSNKATAPILDKGKALGPTVTSVAFSAKGKTRAQFDAECTAALVEAGAEFILLVGYMRILSKEFTDFWAGRCINVHPSLLPKHAGGMDLAVSTRGGGVHTCCCSFWFGSSTNKTLAAIHRCCLPACLLLTSESVYACLLRAAVFLYKPVLIK